jgi:hypothetical protein
MDLSLQHRVTRRCPNPECDEEYELCAECKQTYGQCGSGAAAHLRRQNIIQNCHHFETSLIPDTYRLKAFIQDVDKRVIFENEVKKDKIRIGMVPSRLIVDYLINKIFCDYEFFHF